MSSRRRRWQRHWSPAQASRAIAHRIGIQSRGCAVVEMIIGDIVVRAGADVDEVHLQRVIRAVRSA
ncbi:hypothetical protein WGR33_04420 [Sinorhizobium meliloti]